ncbi:MAG: tetratricopeptide repeat protein [Cyanobacteria bacterium P01_C01_bin.120]
MSSASRLILFQTLSALPSAQFEELRFVLNPPPGIVPEGAAAQGNRVSALLSWVEGATGCGLEQLQTVLEKLHPGILAADSNAEAARDEAPWMVPYARNPYFTGRDDILATLHRQLGDRSTAALSQTQAISGLGGIGKTQTAVEYAYRYRDDYRYVFWVRADTELELTNSYVDMAQTLNLPLKDAENQDETVQSVRVWLTREAGWLLIFDNSDRPELVQSFLPHEISGHILITSRAQDLQDLGIVQSLTMETLSPAEAVSFLLRRTGRATPQPPSLGEPEAKDPPELRNLEDQPSASQSLPALGDLGGRPLNTEEPSPTADPEYTAAAALAAELGYLPLALEQAAAYIVTNRVPVAAYLKSYRKQRLKRLEKAQPKLGNYPDSIATTWALNLKEVQKTAPAAAALLNYCAFLHPDAVPFSLFTHGAAALGEPLATALADAADDPLELYDLLNPLGSYSLIRVEPESQSLSLHRLMQEVIRAELGDGACQPWVEPLLRAINQLLPDKEQGVEYADWPTLAPLVNHVGELAQHCHRDQYESVQAADAFHTLGAYLLERGQYALADPLLQQALKLRQRQLREEHEDIAASLDRMARSHQLQGRYGEAEPLYQEALALYKSLLGKAHPDVANSLNNLAVLYWAQGRYDEAEPLYQEALALRKRLLGEAHPHVANSLNNLASLYKNHGRYDEAEPLYQEALALRKRLLGEAHPDMAQSLSNLAALYYSQGRYGEAEPLYQEALTLRKRLLGEAHPDVAQSLNNLAALYWAQGRYDEAEPLYQEALTLRKRLLGEAHPDVAQSLNNLATLYQQQDRYSDAQPLLLETVNLFRQLLGNKHPNLAVSLNNLARCYRETADYGRAEELCQEALNIADKALPEDHQLKGRFLDDFATLRAAQGRTEEARFLYQQALAILEPKLGADHPWTVRCRDNLAKLE